MILCRKIKLYPYGDEEEVDRVYKFIRDGQYAQYQASNLAMGLLASAYFKSDRNIKSDLFKETQKQITNTNEIFNDIDFASGVDTKSLVTQKIKQDFKTSVRNGLARGERCITNYKRTNPLLTRSRDLKFYTDSENINNINEDIFKKDFNLYLKWVNGIVFNVTLGSLNKSYTSREELRKILIGEYKTCGSSIQIDDNVIILNLSMDIGEIKKIELDENTVVGVDLGLAVPAVCGLNNNKYEREFIGSINEFLRVRKSIQAQLWRARKNLGHVKSGKGRGKKLKALDRFTKKERHFVQTYNHYVSKIVIDFALKYNAKYINLEDLSSIKVKKKDDKKNNKKTKLTITDQKKEQKKSNFKDIILRNWSYYELQQYITYKAEKFGIEVRKIDPYHTSQDCSECGYWEKGQRIKQDKFICKNCGYEDNADFNAAKNIAKSEKFILDK